MRLVHSGGEHKINIQRLHINITEFKRNAHNPKPQRIIPRGFPVARPLNIVHVCWSPLHHWFHEVSGTGPHIVLTQQICPSRGVRMMKGWTWNTESVEGEGTHFLCPSLIQLWSRGVCLVRWSCGTQGAGGSLYVLEH